jgi:hypothetical protein
MSERKSPTRKLIRWNLVITTDGTHYYNKEYKNGDLAYINPDILQPGTIWNWGYFDSAGKILTFGTEDSVLEAKTACDDFNLTFPIDWEA